MRKETQKLHFFNTSRLTEHVIYMNKPHYFNSYASECINNFTLEYKQGDVVIGVLNETFDIHGHQSHSPATTTALACCHVVTISHCDSQSQTRIEVVIMSSTINRDHR